jgi:hypothetical protein
MVWRCYGGVNQLLWLTATFGGCPMRRDLDRPVTGSKVLPFPPPFVYCTAQLTGSGLDFRRAVVFP